MKFNKKQAYENIVSRLTPNGETLSLSERSINDQLETLIPLIANEETELDEFVDKCFPVFKTSNANVNNDVSFGINKYKEEHPEKTVKKNIPAEESELEKRLREMEEWKSRYESKNKIDEIKKSLVSKIHEGGVKDSEWIESMLSEITISEDCDVEAKSKSLVELYNKTLAHVDPDAFTPGHAGGGSGSNASLENVLKQASEFVKSSNI